jgi:sugar phosphate isomerase/epimerase
MRLAVQTYTIRHEMKEDIHAALFKLKSLGVTGIELARVPFNYAIAQVVKEVGLRVESIQVKFHHLDRHFDHFVRFCKEVECDVVVVSVLPLTAIIGGHQAMKRFARRLDHLANRYAQANIILAFHHHAFEFQTIRKKTKFETLYKETSDIVKFVSDTYWTQKSGIDPAAFVANIGKRLIGLHLRDLKIDEQHQFDTHLGDGVIDFPAIFQVLPASVRYGAIEQNAVHPYESIAKSIKFIQPLIPFGGSHGNQ